MVYRIIVIIKCSVFWGFFWKNEIGSLFVMLNIELEVYIVGFGVLSLVVFIGEVDRCMVFDKVKRWVF